MKTHKVYSAWYPSAVPFFQYRYCVVMLGAFWIDLFVEWRFTFRWRHGDPTGDKENKE